MTSGPDLSTTVNGVTLPNPFVIGSGPPGTNYAVMRRALEDGWGGVIVKTLSLDHSKVRNVTPRYAKTFAPDGSVMGWENMELISDRPFDVMCRELARLKGEFPDRVLIGSVMEECDRARWHEIIERTAETGVDAIEINFSCPHGMPERRMGMAMGQDPELLEEVCGWIREVCPVPFWAKMTPNVTDIADPARAALRAGADGISAINTINSVTGVDLDTLAPLPTVEGLSTYGGYSYKAVKPIAMAKVFRLAQLLKHEFNHDQQANENERKAGAPANADADATSRASSSPHAPVGARSLSGIGGVDSGYDAAEFLLAGSQTVQVCTGVMIHGYGLVRTLAAELQEWMARKGFQSLDDVIGLATDKITTHSELLRLQDAAKAARGAAKRKGLAKDDEWTGDEFVKQANSMTSN